MSFLGIAPMNDPQIAIYFALVNPKNTIQYGGVTVGPIIKEALTTSFSILNIPKQEIRRCAEGYRKTCRKFIFKYE